MRALGALQFPSPSHMADCVLCPREGEVGLHHPLLWIKETSQHVGMNCWRHTAEISNLGFEPSFFFFLTLLFFFLINTKLLSSFLCQVVAFPVRDYSEDEWTVHVYIIFKSFINSKAKFVVLLA